jgi:hypothetical protein
MSYSYLTEKPALFTEEGSVMFTRIRDKALSLLSTAGAFQMGKVMVGGGDLWTMLACVDRMVELGELRERLRVRDLAPLEAGGDPS